MDLFKMIVIQIDSLKADILFFLFIILFNIVTVHIILYFIERFTLYLILK